MMEQNPYAPPVATVADPLPVSHGLKRRSVLLMIVFMFVTLGIYYLIWWFRRRPGLNRLNSSKKLALWPLLLMVGLYSAQFGIRLVGGDRPLDEVIGTSGALLLLVFQLGVGILMIVQSFRIKDMIEEHAMPETSSPMFSEQVQLSGLMTFFLSIFYLQWAINRYVVDAER